MKHIESTFQGSGEVELYYQCWRPEEETRAVLVIVHGFGEHSGRYMNIVDYLVPQGYAVYGFDHRGHGRSPGKRGHINEWGELREDVQAFLRLVGNQEPDLPLFLMGHSLGGLIVLESVLRNPEGLKGVIVSGPVLGQVGVSPFLLILSRILSRLCPQFTMDVKLDATAISRDPAVVKAYQEDPLVHSKATARFGAEMNSAIVWTQAHAADWCLPLLILHGGADRLSPAEGSRIFYENVNFPDKKRHEYEGGYHEPHNDIDYEQVIKDFEQWLENHL